MLSSGGSAFFAGVADRAAAAPAAEEEEEEDEAAAPRPGVLVGPAFFAVGFPFSSSCATAARFPFPFPVAAPVAFFVGASAAAAAFFVGAIAQHPPTRFAPRKRRWIRWIRTFTPHALGRLPRPAFNPFP